MRKSARQALAFIGRQHLRPSVSRKTPAAPAPGHSGPASAPGERAPDAQGQRAAQAIQPLQQLQRALGNQAMRALMAPSAKPGGTAQAGPFVAAAIQRARLPSSAPTGHLQRNPFADALAHTHALARAASASGAPAISAIGSASVLRTAAHGVSLSGMQFAPASIQDDGSTTTTARVRYANSAMGAGASIKWSLEGDAFGSSIDANGVITPGTDTVPFKTKDKAVLQVKAVDSKEAGAHTTAAVTLWSRTVLKAKADLPKFVAGSFKGSPALGKFDAVYKPASKTLDAEMKLEFKWFDDNPLDVKDKWTAKRKSAYTSTFIGLARSAWNARFTFANVREPQSVWKRLNPVRVNLKITPVAAAGHYVVEAHRHKDVAHASDKDQWASRAALHGGTTLKVMQGNEKRNPDFRTADVVGGEQKHVDRINPGAITFAKDDAAVASTPKLDLFASYLKRVHHPRIQVELTGHASGGETAPDRLSHQRAAAVAAYLRAQGVVGHPLALHGLGDKGAAAGDPAWQRTDLVPKVDPAFKRNPFDVIPHEFGHLLGLGDEYPYAVGDPKKASDHYALVKEAFGQAYADEVAQQADDPSGNIMFYGNDVRAHDYVTFWSALADATANAGQPTAPFVRADWKING